MPARRNRAIPAEERDERVQKSAAITSPALDASGKLNPAQVGGKGLSEEAKVPPVEEVKVETVPVRKEDGAEEVEVGVPIEGEDVDGNSDVAKKYFIPILKAVDEEQTVTGVVLEPETVDAHDDIYDAGVIRAAAYKFLSQFNKTTKLGFMHTDMKPDFELCESWIAPLDLVINGALVKAGSWVMTVRILSAAKWKLVKEGKITGFSIGGIAKVKKITQGVGAANGKV